MTEYRGLTMAMRTQGAAFGRSFNDVCVQAERLAFQRRCRERQWLAHPYQPKGVH